MGSRILSRSFDVERTGTDEESPQEPDTEADKSTGSAMDVDTPETPTVAEDTSEAQDDRSSEDGDGGEENPVDVSMVPIADLLNVSEMSTPLSFLTLTPYRLDLAPRTYVRPLL